MTEVSFISLSHHSVYFYLHLPGSLYLIGTEPCTRTVFRSQLSLLDTIHLHRKMVPQAIRSWTPHHWLFGHFCSAAFDFCSWIPDILRVSVCPSWSDCSNWLTYRLPSSRKDDPYIILQVYPVHLFGWSQWRWTCHNPFEMAILHIRSWTWPKFGPKCGLYAGLDVKSGLRFTNTANF